MSQFVSSFIVRLLRAAGANGLTGRRTASLPVDVSLADLRQAGRGGQQSFTGFTCDLSSAGLSFVVPTVIIADRHIFCEGGAVLRVRLQLPDGPIEMNARPVRYDSAAGGREGRGYVVGAHILEMSERDRARYIQFLREPTRTPEGDARAKASNPASAVSHAG
jgi:PilZ domain-containing protein